MHPQPGVPTGRPRRVSRVGQLAIVLASAALLAACAQGTSGASPSGSASGVPAIAVTPSASGAGAPTPASSAPVPGSTTVAPTTAGPTAAVPTSAPTTPAQTTPTSAATGPLATLTGVPKGFTLPPGSVVQRATRQAGTSIVNLTAPDASVALPYLRGELTHLGYALIVTKTSGSITAYGYKLGDSLVSLSGGDVGGLSLTAIIFATAASASALA